MATQDQIRSEITQKIADSLKKGSVPWRRPWSLSPNTGAPTNLVSGKAYRGINPLLLSLHQDQYNFSSKWYATFNQWRDLGATVMSRPKDVAPGNWGCGVIFYAQFTKIKEDPKTGEEVEDRFPILKQYSVFNAEQVELPPNLQHLADTEIETKPTEFIDFAPAEAAISATEADIRFGGDRCFYNRASDQIQMVLKERFHSEKEFYATSFHELAHWSESRCGWAGSYPEGELRAEMAASFMCAELSIPNTDDLSNVQAYLASWLKALENDPKYIFKASAAAAKASDHVLSYSRQLEPELIPF